MTSARRYGRASTDLLSQARAELSRGDVVQASEKGWGAAAQMVKSVADSRGWRHNGHRYLFDIVKRLVDESGDQQIYVLFMVANSLHSNFYENWMPQEMVANGLEQVEELVKRIEPLAT